MPENNIMREAWDALVRSGDRATRLWRNNIGTAIRGTSVLIAKHRQQVILEPGDACIRAARYVNFGLVPGSGDLIGIQTVTVTSDMVGKKLGVFVSAEAKTKRGRPTDEQKSWLEMVNSLGGIAFVFRDTEEAKREMALSLERIHAAQ